MTIIISLCYKSLVKIYSKSVENMWVGFGFWMRLFLKKIKAFVWIKNYLHVICIYEHEIDLSGNERIL